MGADKYAFSEKLYKRVCQHLKDFAKGGNTMEPDKQVLITKQEQEQINRDSRLIDAVCKLARSVAKDKARLEEMKK